MKSILAQSILPAALVAGLTFTSAWAQQLPTTGTVKSRLGKIEINNGFPTEATAKKLFDDIDFQRASQAYFRLYGPTQPYFDRSWVLPDIELVE